MNIIHRSWAMALTTLGGLCVAMLATTVLLTVLQVVFRYVLDSPLSWSEELARWLFVWSVFFADSRHYHWRIEAVFGHFGPHP